MNINEFSPKTGRMIDDENVVRNILDPITHNPRNTNSDHSAIHYGLGMGLNLYLSSLAAGQKQIYRINGPETLFAHIKNVEVSGQGATFAVRLIKEPTITTAGVLIANAIQNLNHNSDVVPQSSVYGTDVAYSDGVVWRQKIIHGYTDSSGNKFIQGANSFIQNPNIEYVTTDGNADYILEIENLDLANALSHLDIAMFFYEEPLGFKPLNY